MALDAIQALGMRRAQARLTKDAVTTGAVLTHAGGMRHLRRGAHIRADARRRTWMTCKRVESRSSTKIRLGRGWRNVARSRGPSVTQGVTLGAIGKRLVADLRGNPVTNLGSVGMAGEA